MRSSIILLLLLGFSTPVTADDPGVDTVVEQELLEIRLASYFAAYKAALRNLNDVDLQIAQLGDVAALDKLNELRIRLTAHVEKLELQVRTTAKQLEELRAIAGQIRANAIDQGAQATSLLTDVRAETLQQTMTRAIDFPGRQLRETHRTLDVAIDGPGYFAVVDSDLNSIAYTRLGNLDIDATGHLVVGSHRAGLSLAPPIRIPDNAVTVVISANGVVACRMPGEVNLKHIGQIRLAVFDQALALRQIRESLFAESEASGAARLVNPGECDSGALRQGCLEVSDSERIRELIDVLVAYLKRVKPAVGAAVEP